MTEPNVNVDSTVASTYLGTVGPLQVRSFIDARSADTVYIFHASVGVTQVQGVRVELRLTSSELAALAGLIRYEQGYKP